MANPRTPTDGFKQGYLARHPGIKKAVEDGHVDGVYFEVVDYGHSINSGDTFITEHYGTARLLTCLYRDRINFEITVEGVGFPIEAHNSIRVHILAPNKENN